MRGYTHALSGAAGWLALTSTSTYAAGSQPTAIALAGAAITAGAALLPDIDHPQATIASPSQALTRHVARISGGHRHATHSLIGIAITALAAMLLAWPTWTINSRPMALPAGLAAVLLIAFAARALGLHRNAGYQLASRGSLLRATMTSGMGPWLIAIGTASAMVWFVPGPWWWFAPAVGLGALLHVVGDGLTVEGVPWMWPWNPAPPAGWPWIRRGRLWQANGYFRLPLLGRTTSWRERVVAVALALYVVYVTAFEVAGAAGISQITALLR